MTFEQLLFYGFSGLLIMSALMVVLGKNSVKSVLFLVLCFVASAGLWLLLRAEFLAVALVLVYVGAVMVLFLFVVMMLDVNFATKKAGFTKVLPLALIIALAFLALMKQFFNAEVFNQLPSAVSASDNVNNVEQLGLLLYTDYFYPFEIAAVILLVAMVAAISLTFRGKRNRKSQNIDKQVKVTKAERLRIISFEKEVNKEPKA
ncbi:MAG: NADH-quinone oxidoreductase subunit J [Gammaproteobacteria bacterium]|nr:NADH-quinone oxidoreductase subunit J [Gammaproteobacteria bacterium]